MDVLTNILVWSLIVYRIADDIAHMDGPFEVFAIIRGWTYHERVPDWITNGIHCPVCISWWLSIILTAYMYDARYFAAAGITTVIVKLSRVQHD